MNAIEGIVTAIVDMDEESIEQDVIAALNDPSISLDDIYQLGLNTGMIKAIKRYDNKEYDIPELIVCADVLNKGLKTLRQHGDFELAKKGKILLAVTRGDTHEIGKNIVKIMLEAAGYDVYDFGVNRSNEEILEATREKHIQIIGLSSMMTTTRGEIKELIHALEGWPANERPFIIVGGGSITKQFAVDIGADGYADNAPLAVHLIEKLLEEK